MPAYNPKNNSNKPRVNITSNNVTDDQFVNNLNLSNVYTADDNVNLSSVYTADDNVTGVSNDDSYRHVVVRRDLPFLYQRDEVVPCQAASSTSIISGGKALDFAAFAAGILTLVLNINNNINNNNNNNNNVNNNSVASSNIVTNFNTNNANQVIGSRAFSPINRNLIIYSR